MDKASGAYRTISEVAEELEIPQHVLRFWETRFPHIRPMKRSGGRRYYRPGDVLLLRGIRRLLYGEGYTIKGVQRILSAQGVGVVQQAGGASGEELALAARIEEEAGAAIPAGAGDEGVEREPVPQVPGQGEAGPRPTAPAGQVAPAIDELAAPAQRAPPESADPGSAARWAANQRRVLLGALEELRACARHLAALREDDPDRRIS